MWKRRPFRFTLGYRERPNRSGALDRGHGGDGDRSLPVLAHAQAVYRRGRVGHRLGNRFLSRSQAIKDEDQGSQFKRAAVLFARRPRRRLASHRIDDGCS